jgi:hypothetical protein
MVVAILFLAVPAFASFHLMQIEQVIGGVAGDATAQAIQLRQRAALQNQMQFSRVVAWDAAGANPVVIVAPGSPVAGSALGDRILIASAAFVAATTPAAVPDFTMTAVIPVSYLAAGSLTFENSAGTIIYWRLSWGGGGYTGSTMGAVTNDADRNFGPPITTALPSAGTQAVLFQGAASSLSTTNLADYAATAGDAVFTNNAGQTFTVETPTSARTPQSGVELGQNHPNPFNPSTRISFILPQQAHATLRVYDAGGRYVATLLDGVAGEGLNSVVWDGRDTSGRALGSGVYFYRLESGSVEVSRKMLMLK